MKNYIASILNLPIIFLSACGLLFSVEPSAFLNPPDSARPWVYWFVMDGNLTKEGITADFESMRETGIGGFIMMEVNVGVPRGDVDFMSEQWQERFVHIVREAQRCGLQMTLPSGPGWAGSGGPWITPEDSILHLVTTELQLVGPVDFQGPLPTPAPRIPFFGEGNLPPEIEKARKEFYKDVCVLAFPTPTGNARIADIDEKAVYVRAPYSSMPGVRPGFDAPADFEEVLPEAAIDPSQMVNLTEKMDSEGRLNWQVPEGKWTVMRFAATSTGANTRPAPEPGMGLESSKMDREAFDIHATNFINKLIEAVGERQTDGKAGWCYFHIDSWEMGPQNYSPQFFSEFEKRRGYNPVTFLPAYTGAIVRSAEETERFLWDIRQTAQELIIENHAQYLKEVAHRNHLQLSLEFYDMMPCCDMTFGAVADIPMCEFWSNTFDTTYTCFEAASIGNTHGKPVVSAEAFTSAGDAWRESPKSIKLRGDWAFCSGVNRFTFHRYQHQPYLDKFPGFSMGDIGVHWERTQTWWPLIGAYHTYLSRCQHLLQQGQAVVDVLYLLPEGAPRVFTPPASALMIDGTIKDQRGYRFDGCDPPTLIQLARVEDGLIAFPNATKYRLLVLPNFETMTPRLLRKIEELIAAGATVVGKLPRKSPSLEGYPQVDRVIAEMAEKIRKTGRIIDPDLVSMNTGTGELYPDYSTTAAILTQRGVPCDFVSEGDSLRFYHRNTDDTDYYFVGNRTMTPYNGKVTFRCDRKHFSILEPVTGKRYRVASAIRENGLTTIALPLDGGEAVFVLFEDREISAPTQQWSRLQFEPFDTIDTDWAVQFDPQRGGPTETVHFDTLGDWTTSENAGIKYYSGIARYSKKFEFNGEQSNRRIYIDLGNVEVMAKVILNGKDMGTRWINPYRFEITDAIQDGVNEIVVEAANLWPNRFIGDFSLPEEERTTWSTWSHGSYNADSPLLPSGLIGPVQLMKE